VRLLKIEKSDGTRCKAASLPRFVCNLGKSSLLARTQGGVLTRQNRVEVAAVFCFLSTTTCYLCDKLRDFKRSVRTPALNYPCPAGYSLAQQGARLNLCNFPSLVVTRQCWSTFIFFPFVPRSATSILSHSNKDTSPTSGPHSSYGA
jgi:hypothetical protein